jgi:hypothetical protein
MVSVSVQCVGAVTTAYRVVVNIPCITFRNGASFFTVAELGPVQGYPREDPT